MADTPLLMRGGLLEPAAEGAHWARGVSNNSTFFSPILSIVEMTFRAEFDVLDTSQPVGELWRAIIDYLQPNDYTGYVSRHLTHPGRESL